jgi:hypothetical protein
MAALTVEPAYASLSVEPLTDLTRQAHPWRHFGEESNSRQGGEEHLSPASGHLHYILPTRLALLPWRRFFRMTGLGLKQGIMSNSRVIGWLDPMNGLVGSTPSILIGFQA